jgi:hypothetical protein
MNDDTYAVVYSTVDQKEHAEELDNEQNRRSN